MVKWIHSSSILRRCQVQISTFRLRGISTVGQGVSDVASLGSRVQKQWKRQQNKCFKLKKYIYFLHSTYFKVLSKMKGNSIHNWLFFKVHNFCWGQPLWLLTVGAKKPSYAMVQTGCMDCYTYITVGMENADSANMSNSTYSVLSCVHN
jgi:hypothetical protein